MSHVISYARVALVLLVVCCWSMQAALGQIAPTNSATISGSVSDSSGKPVVGAKVSLSGPKNRLDADRCARALCLRRRAIWNISNLSRGGRIGNGDAEHLGCKAIPMWRSNTSRCQQTGSKSLRTYRAARMRSSTLRSASITQVNPIANAFEGKTSWRTILEQIPGVAQAGARKWRQHAIPLYPMVRSCRCSFRSMVRCHTKRLFFWMICPLSAVQQRRG